MAYLAAFLHGLAAVFSPCLLLLLLVFISYFAGGDQRGTARTLLCVLGAITGFAVTFTAIGSLADNSLPYGRIGNLISGCILIVFGLNFPEPLRRYLPHGGSRILDAWDTSFFSAALFGGVLAAGWTPCVSACQALILRETAMLPACRLGLVAPFLASAILIDALKRGCDCVKRHNRLINLLCGGLLIVIGVLMAAGTLERFLRQPHWTTP